MNAPHSPPLPHVQALDTATLFPDSKLLESSAAAARFREAVPDYLALLNLGGEQPMLAERKSLERWTARWALKRLGELTPEDVRDHLRSLAGEGLSARELEKEKILLRTFYRWALRNGRSSHAPLEGLEREHARPVSASPVVWKVLEQRRLLDACRGRFTAVPRQPARGRRSPDAPGSRSEKPAPSVPRYLHPLVFIALRTGLRLGDLLELQWSHIHLYRRRIIVPEWQGSDKRTVNAPISKDVLALLMNLFQYAKKLPEVPQRVLEAVGLPLWNDRPHERDILLAFRTVRKRAAIPEGDFHSLRWTFICNCACAHVPREAAARLCGWDEGDELLKALYAGELSKPGPRTA